MERHIAWLRDLNRAERTIYLRRKLLTRLADHLAPATLLEATHDDLIGWGRELTVGPDTRSAYFSHFVFRRRDRRAGPNNPALVSKLANDYLREWNYTIHQLRHWYASQLLRETGNLRLVQEMLGHASPATTAVYTLVDLSSAAAAMASFPGIPPRLAA